ncbi:MAG: hypothetical protein WBA16_10185 [Nonlabens sp.]
MVNSVSLYILGTGNFKLALVRLLIEPVLQFDATTLSRKQND